MPAAELRFGPPMNDGFRLYSQHMVLLILAAIIAVLITVVSLGILGGAMAAGLAHMVLRLKDGITPPPPAKEVFKGFDWFLTSLLVWLIWLAAMAAGWYALEHIPSVGWLLARAWLLLLQGLQTYSMFRLVDGRAGLGEALSAPLQAFAARPGPMAGILLLSSLIAGIGAVVCGVGSFITIPIQYCIVAEAYRHLNPAPADSATPGVGPAAGDPAGADAATPPPPPPPPA